ncbi:DUF4392 domain-containing protein [Candidatus Pantoea deserta]|uniref:DUF4392 domain-containing protein n=1 Tax=Candidatus Pantoea deserta TaxID=1869313 RepID=A0A3N4NHQ9_9GAMM|nr:glutamate cyclase domain-containing protein [Pantoea deserta]RPD95942.1 DUF4392 domain-containing protein [Pantoea deserta]
MMTPANHEQIVGERIDQLMSLEMRPLRGKGLPSGYVSELYRICRAYHGEPLSMLAARRLALVLAPDKVVVIATGAGIAPNLPFGETDGPPGALVLARILADGFGCRVLIATEDDHMLPVKACCDVIQPYLKGKGSISTIAFSKGLAEGKRLSSEIFERFSPAAVIFVERDGPNAEGYFHGVRGDYRTPDQVGHLYLLASLSRERNVLTVGIGDGGNEVGFGEVREQVAKAHPYGAKSLGKFPSGVITVTATDIVVASSVSNWGAYAVTAALAWLLRRQDLTHFPECEKQLIKACVVAGGRDGATSRQVDAVDGIDLETHMAFTLMLGSIVSISL